MYIKNAEKFLTDLGFIGDENTTDESFKYVEYYLKVNENLQLFAVSTDVNDIMLMSEHKIIKPNNKKFEYEEENIEILTEFVFEKDIINLLKKHNLIAD